MSEVGRLSGRALPTNLLLVCARFHTRITLSSRGVIFFFNQYNYSGTSPYTWQLQQRKDSLYQESSGYNSPKYHYPNSAGKLQFKLILTVMMPVRTPLTCLNLCTSANVISARDQRLSEKKGLHSVWVSNSKAAALVTISSLFFKVRFLNSQTI